MDVLGLDDLERGKEWRQNLTGPGVPASSFSTPTLLSAILASIPSEHGRNFPGRNLAEIQSGNFCRAAGESQRDC